MGKDKTKKSVLLENKDCHIGFQVKTLNNLICRRMVQEVEKTEGLDDMTARHSWIIGYLCHNKDKEIYQKTIEHEFDITKSTVASVLKNMEKHGYIIRQGVANDARLKKIMVTPLGEEIHSKFMAKILCVEEELFEALSTEEAKEYLRISDKLKRNIKTALEINQNAEDK